MAKKDKDELSVYDDIVGIMTKAAEESGMVMAAYDEHSKTVKVVPIPPISLQWLINSNGWPLGRMTSSAGDPKTFKSTFAHQLVAWYIMAGGAGNVIDTENKQSGETLEAMINSTGLEPATLRKRCLIGSATSMEQWQGILLHHSEGLVAKYKDPQNCPIPFVNVIDSLTGVNSQAGTDELVENDGGVAQSRVGQQNAKALYQFMRDGARRSMVGSVPTNERWPTTLHLVSHQRDRGDGLKGKARSGGVSPDFYTSLDLVFTKGGTSSYNNTDKSTPDCGKKGRIITITVRYSSMGPDGNEQKMSVPVLIEFFKDPETGRKRKRIMYDWGAADTHFLGKNYDKIKKVFHMETKWVRGHGEYAKSDTLGIPDFIPASQFGYALQANPKVMELLQNELGIECRPAFVYLPGITGITVRPTVALETEGSDEISVEEEDDEEKETGTDD